MAAGKGAVGWKAALFYIPEFIIGAFWLDSVCKPKLFLALARSLHPDRSARRRAGRQLLRRARAPRRPEVQEKETAHGRRVATNV
mgnify:CR=1 FL=1